MENLNLAIWEWELLKGNLLLFIKTSAKWQWKSTQVLYKDVFTEQHKMISDDILMNSIDRNKAIIFINITKVLGLLTVPEALK